MAPLPVTLVAPAKLTLSLRVGGLRPDGFHEIDAEMVAIDLADEIQLRAAGPGPVPFDVVDHASGSAVEVGPVATNLVMRALELVGERPAVRVLKRIAPGAGLAGGSSDAAAVLRWAGCTGATEALSLGADVPFCVLGGRARVGGAGELVEPLAFEPRSFTLLTPPFGCATAEVYRAWDALSRAHGGGSNGGGSNDLEPAALLVEPRLGEYRDRLSAATGCRARLAGSGSTWFVEGAFPGEDRVVVHTVPAPG